MIQRHIKSFSKADSLCKQGLDVTHGTSYKTYKTNFYHDQIHHWTRVCYFDVLASQNYKQISAKLGVSG